MNTYLVIITTVLVITQVIRVIQNTLSLRRQNAYFRKNVQWIKDNDISEKDFQTQRHVYELLEKKLEAEDVHDNG